MRIGTLIFFLIPLLPVIALVQGLRKKGVTELRRSILMGFALIAFLLIGMGLAIPTVGIGMVGSWGSPGLGPEALQQTEILCTGHFSSGWFPFPWTQKVTLNSDPVESPIERSIPAKRRMGRFIVDQYWKGVGPPEIEVALFEPSEGYWGDAWNIPVKKNLLVALKKDSTGSGGYQLVNQANSWLVVENSSRRPGEGLTPRETIEALARDEVLALAADPKTQGQSVDGRYYKRFRQAAGTLAKFRAGDPEVAAALETYISNPTSPLQRHAFITLTKVDPVRAWKIGREFYQTKVLEPLVFGHVFPEIITPEIYSKISTAELGDLSKNDPSMAIAIADAFRNMDDPRALPWLVQCLNHPNLKVQFFGIHGLHKMFGAEKLPMPFVSTYEENPEKYLSVYKKWLAEAKGGT